ncbi:MAG: hypothetical protein KBD16_03920, partial [Candidatus Pacebacteria bacterium]|nr:hypothetical protein [Candidatus Paceibacterota bacterium]
PGEAHFPKAHVRVARQKNSAKVNGRTCSWNGGGMYRGRSDEPPHHVSEEELEKLRERYLANSPSDEKGQADISTDGSATTPTANEGSFRPEQ